MHRPRTQTSNPRPPPRGAGGAVGGFRAPADESWPRASLHPTLLLSRPFARAGPQSSLGSSADTGMRVKAARAHAHPGSAMRAPSRAIGPPREYHLRRPFHRFCEATSRRAPSANSPNGDLTDSFVPSDGRAVTYRAVRRRRRQPHSSGRSERTPVCLSSFSPWSSRNVPSSSGSASSFASPARDFSASHRSSRRWPAG